MHSKSDNIEIVINDITNKVMKNFLNHFLIDIKLDWKHSKRGSDFIFDCVHLLYYKFHKINFKQSG